MKINQKGSPGDDAGHPDEIVVKGTAKPCIHVSGQETQLDPAAHEWGDLDQIGISFSRRDLNMTRILLVDDHDMVRKRIRLMIQGRKNWQVCGEAADGREAIHKHSVLKPHVVVMDFNMPRLNGIDASRRILKDHPSACILMVSVSASQQLMEEVKKAGIRGFCSKSCIDALSEAVEALLRGETYFPEQQVER